MRNIILAFAAAFLVWSSAAQTAETDPLMSVQRQVNLKVNLVEERRGNDVWKIARIGGSGDCEDFALLKRKLLIENHGYKPEDLVIVLLVNEKRWTGHAVLVVKSVGMVLDIPTKGNRRKNLKPIAYRAYLKKSGYSLYCVAGDISTSKQYKKASDRCIKR